MASPVHNYCGPRILGPVLVLILFIGATGAAFGGVVSLNYQIESINISRRVEYFPDPEADLTVDQAARIDRFKTTNRNWLNLGSYPGAVWLRLRLTFQDLAARQTSWTLAINRESLDSVQAFFPKPGGGWTRVDEGTMTRAGSSGVLARYPVIPIPPDLADGSLILIRLQSGFTLGTAVTISSCQAFQRKQLVDNYVFGLLYGAPLALAAFNFFIFLSLRDKVYLYYVVYITSMAVYQALVYGQIRLLDLLPPDRNITLYGIVGVSLFFAALFTKSFLMTKKTTPLMDKLLTVFMALAVVRTGASLIGWSVFGNHLAQFMGMVSPLLTITTGVLCWRRGFSPAKYYVLGWAVLSICMGWHVLVSLSVLPWFGWSSMMMIIGSNLEAILLSFALADRIRVLRLERETARLWEGRYRTLSRTDSLTGLYNRRYLELRLGDLVQANRETGLRLALIIMDIDDFKLFNDNYGHLEGDRVLVRLAEVIRDQTRASDEACRYGGEEFVVLMPGAGLDQAVQAAERIRLAFAEQTFEIRQGRVCTAHLSLGAAQMRPNESGPELLRRADEALYEAKKGGKNRVAAAP